MSDPNSDSPYTVGRGKPPLHTRFQKGQSGNPSGRPGPAKLVKQSFQRALCQALEGSLEDLKGEQTETIMDAVVRRIALDATEGRAAAQRLLLSALDASATESSSTVTVFGKGEQRNLHVTMDDLMDIVREELARQRERIDAEWEASLLQGKEQGSLSGNGPHSAKPIMTDASKKETGKNREPGAQFSLGQGKTQGRFEKSTGVVAARGQLLSSTAALAGARPSG